jgi:hypothetical protein
MGMKRKAGRPPKPKATKQGRQITVYLTDAEYRRIAAQAKQEGLSLASFIMRPWREER